MRFKNIIYVTILVLTTVITSWSIPALVKKIVYESNGYPSDVLQFTFERTLYNRLS